MTAADLDTLTANLSAWCLANGLPLQSCDDSTEENEALQGDGSYKTVTTRSCAMKFAAADGRTITATVGGSY